MAYITQEQKKQKALLIKPLLKKFGLKGSLSIQNMSTINLNLRAGSLDFLGEFNQYQREEETRENFGVLPEFYCEANRLSITNDWHIEKYSEKVKSFLTQALDILNAGNHDHSDPSTDYFNVGWYSAINIGQWSKPYQLT